MKIPIKDTLPNSNFPLYNAHFTLNYLEFALQESDVDSHILKLYCLAFHTSQCLLYLSISQPIGPLHIGLKSPCKTNYKRKKSLYNQNSHKNLMNKD